MSLHSHPLAKAEARELVIRHDGSAGDMVEEAIAHSIEGNDLVHAVELDQVRREIDRIYETEGK